ncbi:MAG: hypothetical protein KAY27_01530 [Pedobacter sp.]|nr:hypothetical protein [Pedobacter sp.]
MFKIIIKNTVLVVLLVIAANYGFAQKQSDIRLMPALKTNDPEITRAVGELLLNKVKNEIILQGYAGVNTSRFIVLVNPVAADKQNNGQLLTITYDIQFSVIDIFTDKTYNSFTIPVGGVGKSSNLAFVDAIRRIDLSKTKLGENLSSSVKDIISYYNTNCNAIIERANVYLASGQFEAALSTLAFIPDINSLSCRTSYNVNLLKIMQQYSLYKCNSVLTKAKQAWSLDPTIDGAKAVSSALLGISLTPACKKDFEALLAEIKAKLKNDQFDDKEFAKRIVDSSIALERDQIAASRDIAVAYYQNLRPTSYIYLH